MSVGIMLCHAAAGVATRTLLTSIPPAAKTARQVAVDSLDDVHKHPPSLKLWQKVAPLAIIFFGASFNLTILQVRAQPFLRCCGV